MIEKDVERIIAEHETQKRLEQLEMTEVSADWVIIKDLTDEEESITRLPGKRRL